MRNKSCEKKGFGWNFCNFWSLKLPLVLTFYGSNELVFLWLYCSWYVTDWLSPLFLFSLNTIVVWTGFAQMVCGSCRRLLSYPPGAKHVKCSCCQTVNIVLEGQFSFFSWTCLSCETLHFKFSFVWEPLAGFSKWAIRISIKKTISHTF